MAREHIQLHHPSSLMKRKAGGKAGTAELTYCRRKTVTFSFVIIQVGLIGQILKLARLWVLLFLKERKSEARLF